MRRTVLTYGTFDLFHLGHERILARAAALGSHLYVGVSTDAFNAEKGKASWDSYACRKANIEALGLADLVFPELAFEQKPNDIRRLDIDVLVMGDDWKGRFDWLSDLCEVVYLPRTPGISSTMIKLALGARQEPLAGRALV
jgi:glycerol-3-phosphate cytidylyltransferase